MLKSCPNSIDVLDLEFKLQSQLKIFENKELQAFPNTYNLISCASRYGLLFVGTNNKAFEVIQTKELHLYTPKEKNASDYPKRNIQLSSQPKHLCVNCDNTILAVVTEKTQCPVVEFYEVVSFLKKDIRLIKELRLSSTPNIYIKEINWNPSIPGVFTACKSDGSLGVYELKGESIDINELPPASGATCFCWSPKGRQIAVGSKDGKITQYKPDLKAVKVINSPRLQAPHSLICLQWVSNYQFVGVYQSGDPDGGACLIVVDAPKTGETLYTNYDDVCYSNTSRPAQFYFILAQHWNILMVASANSMEIGVLGSVGDIWTQWIMPDPARAALPLSSNHDETFPVGITFDISSTTPLPWGETTIPPCPLLIILSHHGVLCCFNVVYLKKDVPSICSPPEVVTDSSGLESFVRIPSMETKPKTAEVAKTAKPAAEDPPQLIFGGQASITPVATGQQKTISLTGQTAILQTSNTFDPINSAKYASIFSALNTSVSLNSPQQSSPISTRIETPIVQILPKPKDDQASKPDASAKLEIQQIDPKLKAETSAMLTQMIKDECKYLESELNLILNQTRIVKVNLGTEEEKAFMVQQLDLMDEFLKEVADINVGQNSEVHCLKQNLIQGWAWFEEAQAHYNSAKNEAITLLVKSQPLDSVSEKRLSDIQQLIYYIDSQLSQANKALDEQWDIFQDYAKKVHRIQMPTMETIFQTMVRQNAILQKQTYVLKDIAMRLRKKNSTSDISQLRLIEENKISASDLSLLHLSAKDVLMLHYDKVLNQLKSLSQAKSNKLKDLLKQRKISHVTAVKPQLTWSLNQSPANKTKQMISLLGAHMSPVPRNSCVKNLNKEFTQSTPIREFASNQNLPLKPVVESAIVPKEVASTPVPSNGSIITSKPGSAFASTLQMKSGFLATTSIPRSIPVSSTAATAPLYPFGGSVSTKSDVAKVPISTHVTTPANITFTFNSITSKPSEIPLSAILQPKNQTKETIGFAAPPNSASAVKIASPLAKSISTTSVPVVFSSAVAPSAELTKAISVFAPENKASGNLQKSVSMEKTESLTPIPKTQATLPPLDNTTKSSVADSLSKNSKPISAISPVPVVTISTKNSFFGAKPIPVIKPNTKPSLALGVTMTQQPIISSTVSPSTATIFGSSSLETTPKPSVFGVISQAQPIFGNIATSVQTTITESGSAAKANLFAQSTTGTNIFAMPISTTTSTPFNTATTATNIFTTPITSVGVSSANTFGNLTSTTTPTANIFGGTSPNSLFSSNATPSSTTSVGAFGTTPTNIFASLNAPTSSASPTLFGTAPQNIFKSADPVVTTSSGLFGANTSASIFGASNTATTTSSGVFGQASNTFGNTANAFGTSGSIFATPATSTNKFGNIFASPATTSSIFGSVTSTTSSGSSVFDNVMKPTGSAFGTQSSFQNSQSIFGSAPNSPTSPVFGVPQTTVESSVFGKPAFSSGSSIFGSTSSNVFGSTAPTNSFGSGFPTSSASTFGSSPTSPVSTQSSFGFDNLNVASTAPPTGNLFGGSNSFAPTSAANPFSKAENKSPFASSSSNIFGTPAMSSSGTSLFGNPASTASSVFGSNTGFSSSTFGQKSAFGQSTFGNTSFGSPQPGAFSGGNNQGSFSTFQKPGFGSPPVFGGSTTPFSGASTFGGSPTFGGAPTFGSPEKVFGAQTGTFGSATPQPQQTTGFGSLANQTTIGFGNLAQASAQNSMPFSGGSSFSSWR